MATGAPVKSLAEKHGYTKKAFYDVINGRTRTPKLQKLISDLTGFPVATLWPDRHEYCSKRVVKNDE